jgi:hypothetical protein
MKINKRDCLQVIAAILFTGSTAVAMQPPTTLPISKDIVVVNVIKPIESPAKAPVIKKGTTWQDNPNNCTSNQWIAKEAPFSCIDKVNPVMTASTGSGDCASEIAKYDWDYNTAINVSTAESGMNPGAKNDNPSTGDYSIGCFQVNIYGANAASRPSEEQLKNAAINVKWAYNNYVANGHSFIGQWGVCRKIACY